MRLPSISRFQLTAMSLCLALYLAGCGGGGGGAEQVPPSAAEVTSTATSTQLEGPLAVDNLPETKQIAEASTTFADGASIQAEVDTVAAVAIAQTPIEAAVAEAAVARTAQADRPIAAGTSAASASVDYFVATAGNDSWSGLLATANGGGTDGPLRTISAAQARVRQRLAAMANGSEARAPINVRIGSGEYRLSTPLTFDATDSGEAGSPVVYRAETAGGVMVSGASLVGQATGTASGTLMTLPGPALDAVNQRGGTQLYVNTRRATLARTPNAGAYWFVKKAVPLASEPVDKAGQEAFVPPPEALTLLNGLTPTDRSQALIHIMQAWSAGAHRMSNLAAPAGAVRVSPRALWPFLKFGTDQRFYVENIPSALDAPGEWIWSGSNLHYISTAADAGKPLRFEMPLLDKLLVVSGNAATANWVHDLEFRGLNFAHTRQLIPDAGVTDNQAGVNIGAAIEVDAARRIVIDNCGIDHTGGYGVWLRTAVRDSKVSNCRMGDLGAGGVKVGLASQSPTDVNGTGLNTIYANTITDTGKVIPGAVGVWIGQSSDNTVDNNLIANTSYTAISVGWKWDYGTATASRNSIRNNLLLNIGLGQMSDMGAIYTLGESPGTVISGNVVHEVRPYPGYGAGAWGLYNDGASTGVLWERNVVVGTNDGGYLQNYGRNNTVRSNLLAFGDRSEVRVTRTDPALTKLTFDANLLIPKNTTPLVGYATFPDVNFSGNKVSNRVLATPADISKCGAGCSTSSAMVSVASDPRIVTVTGADAATVAWLATVSANVGPPGLAAASVPVVNASLPTVVVAPPTSYEAEILETTIGGKPFNLQYRTGGNASAISVQAATGTPSGKCLRFIDSAAIVNRWEPYAWATLSHTGGTSTVDFSITIDANTNYLHEWRDNENMYLTGPSLRIKTTGIEVAGKIVARAPKGEWITLKVVAPLGTAAGTWTLQVVYSDGSTVNAGTFANKNAGWNRLNWLGFVSDAAVSATSSIGFIKANTSLQGL